MAFELNPRLQPSDEMLDGPRLIHFGPRCVNLSLYSRGAGADQHHLLIIITRNLLRGRFVSGVRIVNVAVIQREGNREV